MNCIQEDSPRFRRGVCAMRPFTAMFVAAALLVPASVCFGRRIDKVNVERIGDETTATFRLAAATGAAASADGAVAGLPCFGFYSILIAVVIEDGLLAEDWDLEILEVTPGSYDFDVDGYTDELRDALEAATSQDDYDSEVDDLFFVRYYSPDPPCPGLDEFVVRYTLLVGGEPAYPNRFVWGATNWLDLKDDSGKLENFESLPVDILDVGGEIPTLSSWGLTVMALLLLIGARTYFGRRSTIQNAK